MTTLMPKTERLLLLDNNRKGKYHNTKTVHACYNILIRIRKSEDDTYGIKLFKYRTAGVREYWIVNPMKKTVMVYDFENEKRTQQYSFDDTISVCINEDFNINIAELL